MGHLSQNEVKTGLIGQPQDFGGTGFRAAGIGCGPGGGGRRGMAGLDASSPRLRAMQPKPRGKRQARRRAPVLEKCADHHPFPFSQTGT